MLASENRLKSARDIARVFKRGNYGKGGLITAKATHSGLSDSRAVVVVSKKISKRAVVRNKIRRRIVEIVRQRWETVRPGYDIVITVRGDVSSLDHSTLNHNVVTALTRVAILKNES